jgi:hypothetical protein
VSELNLVERVQALHTNEQGGVTPGLCHCEACVETMDILKTIDSLPDMHLLKMGDDGWAIEHPLACRLDLVVRGLTLHDCELHKQAHSILHDGKPGHLVASTYELEYQEGEGVVVRSTLGGGGKWWPLKEPHDPVSQSSRSPGG